MSPNSVARAFGIQTEVLISLIKVPVYGGFGLSNGSVVAIEDLSGGDWFDQECVSSIPPSLASHSIN
jgi:hypothetical protein